MTCKRSLAWSMVAVAAWLGPIGSAWAQFDIFKKTTEAKEPTQKIAHFEISGAVAETPVSIPPLFGADPPVSLKALLARFKEAREDPSVVAVVVDLQNAALGMAQLEEIHEAIAKFAAVDKDVYVHADGLTTRTYAAATAATYISLVPTGNLWLMGIYGESLYLRGMFDKLAVIPDFVRCGEYKSAVEIFTRTGPSEAAREMSNWLMDGLYASLVKLIADGRGMSEQKVRSWIDNAPYVAEEAVKIGLIDAVESRQDFIRRLEDRYGESTELVMHYADEDLFDIPQDNFFAVFDFLMKLMNPSRPDYTEPTVGIVYVDGMILTGEPEGGPFGSSDGAYSTPIRKALNRAAAEPMIKAVVLRVDSGGGSALASDIILDASKRVAAKKPLIVSMGNVAGSGGYYVACGGHAIIADRATITGSIGVLGGKLVTTGMWDKLGINWHPMQRGEMAAMLSSAAPFSDQERAKFIHYIDVVYADFKQRVTKSRSDRLAKPLDEIAGGRVYTGAQALELGLVDQLGGLDDAVKMAADRAKLVDYDIRVIPDPPNIFDMLTGGTEDEGFVLAPGVRGPALFDLPMVRSALSTLAKTDPLRVRAVIHALQRIELIHREGVVMMMPEELLIR